MIIPYEYIGSLITGASDKKLARVALKDLFKNAPADVLKGDERCMCPLGGRENRVCTAATALLQLRASPLLCHMHTVRWLQSIRIGVGRALLAWALTLPVLAFLGTIALTPVFQCLRRRYLVRPGSEAELGGTGEQAEGGSQPLLPVGGSASSDGAGALPLAVAAYRLKPCLMSVGMAHLSYSPMAPPAECLIRMSQPSIMVRKTCLRVVALQPSTSPAGAPRAAALNGSRRTYSSSV